MSEIKTVPCVMCGKLLNVFASAPDNQVVCGPYLDRIEKCFDRAAKSKEVAND